MRTRYAAIAALIMGIVLVAHSVTAFMKNRWVTGLVELVAALVLLWNWWLARSSQST